MVALAVPVIIRKLTMADEVADAIDARSFEYLLWSGLFDRLTVCS